MAKLYPPYIEGVLPAFGLKYNKDKEDWDGVIVIPFSLNKAVSQKDVLGMKIKIKSVQNDVLLGSANVCQWDVIKQQAILKVINREIIGKDEAHTGITVRIGASYKIQMCFEDNKGIEGYWSTVGVIKCTTAPQVDIMDPSNDGSPMNTNIVYNNSIHFIGRAVQDEGGDVTEKIYSSKFIVTDPTGKVIADSGDVLHNVNEDPNSYTAYDTFNFNQELRFGEVYHIQYFVTTTNGLEVETPKFALVQQKSLNSALKGQLVAKLNADDGYVNVGIIGYRDKNNVEESVVGQFVLFRQDTTNPNVWEELTRFAFHQENPTRTIFTDHTVEQGKTYIYSIQQFNNYEIYSARKESNAVKVNFDDMFLYDGEHQLKLAFNPQVSSFKTQLAETQTETIGSKYPFFYRNGKIGYKTFPISGLLSMLTDDNQWFTKYSDILRKDYTMDRCQTPVDLNYKDMPHACSSTDLSADNFVSERLFKLKVLDWLNNGKPKLFRSPAEGNYVVRLMDVSLAPEQNLGRMLHTVSATAYECADCSYKSLVDNGIIEPYNSVSDAAKGAMWREIDVANYNFNGYNYSNNLLKSDDSNSYTNMLRFTDLMPGTQIAIVFDQNLSLSADQWETDPFAIGDNTRSTVITIGATGNYYADELPNIYGIYLRKPDASSNYYAYNSGTIGYQFKAPIRNEFDSVVSINASLGGYTQLVGDPYNSLSVKDEITAQYKWKDDAGSEHSVVKEEPTQLCVSSWHVRPIENLYTYYTLNQIRKKVSNKLVQDSAAIGLESFGPIPDNDIDYDKIPLGTHLSDPIFKKVYDYFKDLIESGRYDIRLIFDIMKSIGFNPPFYIIKSEISKTKVWDTIAHTWKAPISELNGQEVYFQDRDIIMEPGAQYLIICHIREGLPYGGENLLIRELLEHLDVILGSTKFDNCILDNIFFGSTKQKPERETIINDIFYWDLDFDPNEKFSDEESLKYSPFSYYILVNASDINSHRPIKGTVDVSHLYEKYYIDRYYKAQTPEEKLQTYSSIADKYWNSNDISEKDKEVLWKWLSDNPLYVLDAWTGQICDARKWTYQPYVMYNGNQIDLREIKTYDINNLDFTNEKEDIEVGNGVYGEVLYQKVTLTYACEETDPIVKEAKNNLEEAYKRAKEIDASESDIENAKNEYKKYVNVVGEAESRWVSRIN